MNGALSFVRLERDTSHVGILKGAVNRKIHHTEARRIAPMPSAKMRQY